MSFLNYHHLRYFRVIARERSIARAAETLHVTPAALSVQLKQLEESLGHALMERTRGGLLLTEAGRVALDYADIIGRAGEELVDVMRHRPRGGRQILRVAAVSTLSRNFQLEVLQPALRRADVEVVVRTGALRDLLGLLKSHQVDLVLSDQAAQCDAETPWHSHLLDEEPVVLVGVPAWTRKRLKFPGGFEEVPLVLPSLESNTRMRFDRLLADAGVRPQIMAEVDDMAMLRLLARESGALSLVPQVVVRDEIERRELVVTHRIPDLHETFHAIAPTRRFPNALAAELIRQVQSAKRPGRRTRGTAHGR